MVTKDFILISKYSFPRYFLFISPYARTLRGPYAEKEITAVNKLKREKFPLQIKLWFKIKEKYVNRVKYHETYYISF